MSHTPGPWTYRKTTGHNVIVIESDYMRDDIGCIVNAVEERDQDNARLIAAAPDLLAALKAHVEYECSQSSGERHDPTPEQAEAYFAMMERSLEALRKAEKPLDRSEEVK